MLVGDAGRPEKVYCNSYRPKFDQLLHELLLTDFLLAYPDADVLRGWAVDRHRRPDAEMTLDGDHFDVELDTGEQSYAQVRRRQQRYIGSENRVLYVTTSRIRLAGLIEHTHEAIRPITWFTTLDAAIQDPLGAIWSNCHGEAAAI